MKIRNAKIDSKEKPVTLCSGRTHINKTPSVLNNKLTKLVPRKKNFSNRFDPIEFSQTFSKSPFGPLSSSFLIEKFIKILI